MYNTTINAGALTPWQAAQYQLMGWWDMQLFSAKKFFQMATLLEQVRNQSQETAKKSPGYFSFDKTSRSKIEKILLSIREVCSSLSLPNSEGSVSELINTLHDWAAAGAANISATQMADRFDEIQRTIRREMSLHLFMYIPHERAECYRTYERANDGDGEFLFGITVAAGFPSASYDIDEAGNCYAVARYTACVFHLMRVMEIAVQALGDKLGVESAGEKEWQKIVNDIRGKLNDKFPKHQEPNRVKYESILGHLETVKIAWRNPTMHPKATYTDEEALELMRTVKIFMIDLANLVLLKDGQT